MIGWLASFLTGPVIRGAIEAYRAKLDAGNDKERIAAELAGRELAVQQEELRLQTQLRTAQIGRWYTAENLCCYVVTLYFAKCVVFDTMLGLGSTPPLRGLIGEWAVLIMLFLFGKRGFENIARILRR